MLLPDSQQGQHAPQKKAVVNPYLPCSNRQQLPPECGCNPIMGLHSKQRVGSILTAKRHGAGRKKLVTKRSPNRKNQLVPSRRLGDSQGFMARQHCVVCKAMFLG